MERPMIYTGYQWRDMKPEEIEIMCNENVVPIMPRYPEAGDIYIEQEETKVNDGLFGVLGELEREYKRTVAMNSIQSRRKFNKGYLAGLLFAIKVLRANEEEAE